MTKLPKTLFLVLLTCILLVFSLSPLWSFHAGPYAGLALEYQQFRGEREDRCRFDEQSGGGSEEFVPLQDFNSGQAGFEVFGGCLYHPCCCDWFLIGYEGYLACDFNKDTSHGLIEDCHQTSTLRRNFNAGILFKGGVVVCEDYFIYGLVGPDVGYFKWTQTEVGQSKVTDKQTLMGIRYGAGIEREFNCFRVGLQVDYTHYSSKTFSAQDASGNTPNSHFKPNILNIGLRFSVPLG